MEKYMPREIVKNDIEAACLKALNNAVSRFLGLGEKGLEMRQKNKFGNPTILTDKFICHVLGG